MKHNQKRLSNGTVAKPGMIVVVMKRINGNKVDTITRITNTSKVQKYKLPFETICCEAIDPPSGWYNGKCRVWAEYVKNLREATINERKEYYKKKFKNI